MAARRMHASLLAMGLCAAILFLLSAMQAPALSRRGGVPPNGDVVFHPALLELLYGGDAFLAANVEMARILTSGRVQEQESLGFFVRMHEGVSRLNPCHEDGYYIASAFLSSGGAVKPALKTLERAAKCRFWDEWTPFLLGVNQYFYARDPLAAVDSFKEGARRAPTAKVAKQFNTIAIATMAAQFDDVGVAIKYLVQEKEQAKDEALKAALAKRIVRLEGLAALRKAQADYESRFRKTLADPKDLLLSGTLKEFPADPLGIGYEFNEGRFELKQIVLNGQGK